MKKLIVAASCALAMMTGTAQAQDLRIAFDIPYEPFEYRDDNGDAPGFPWSSRVLTCGPT